MNPSIWMQSHSMDHKACFFCQETLQVRSNTPQLCAWTSNHPPQAGATPSWSWRFQPRPLREWNRLGKAGQSHTEVGVKSMSNHFKPMVEYGWSSKQNEVNSLIVGFRLPWQGRPFERKANWQSAPGAYRCWHNSTRRPSRTESRAGTLPRASDSDRCKLEELRLHCQLSNPTRSIKDFTALYMWLLSWLKIVNLRIEGESGRIQEAGVSWIQILETCTKDGSKFRSSKEGKTAPEFS